MEVVSDIQILIDDYMQTLDDGMTLQNRPGLFVDMLKYLYQNHVKYILKNDKNKNANRYNDLQILDDLWKLYTSLVYRHKKNGKPSLIEYSMFTGIDYSTIMSWNNKGYASATHSTMVKRWVSECENAYKDSGTVFDIFMLKSKYGYVETAPIHIDSIEQKTEVTQLPDFMSTNAIIDTNATEV